MPTHNALSNCVLSINLAPKSPTEKKMDDIYLVSVRVTGADGRLSENQGAVAIAHLKGDALANAVLKATTKAIRRAVLSHVWTRDA
jgi:recombination DNA repair RAD52 pathway protein